MPTETVTVHPSGQSLAASAQAWYLRDKQQWKWKDIRAELRNVLRKVPSFKPVRNAVARVRSAGKRGLPKTAYANCGRKRALTDVTERAVVAFVRKWRAKRFCTCQYIAQELTLDVTPRTVANVFNRHGYYWRAVPKVTPLEAKHIAKRKAFVDKYGKRTAGWWKKHMSLVIDGVTLTKAPAGLSGRQKHAAQNVGFMWMRRAERFSRWGAHVQQVRYPVGREGAALGRHHRLRSLRSPAMDSHSQAEQGAVGRARASHAQGHRSRRCATSWGCAVRVQGLAGQRGLPAATQGVQAKWPAVCELPTQQRRPISH